MLPRHAVALPRPALRACAAATLSLCALLTAPSVAAQARDLDPQTVVTVASRWPVPQAQLAADVVVITREDLQALPADNLADVLQQRAGIQLSRTGGPGQPSSALVRGASASNTVVLVDGVRVGSATTGQFDFATLGLAGIERIEVLRGPGSSLHGADAVGGVVLITTRSAGGASLPWARAEAAVGSHGSSEVQALVRSGSPSGPWDAQVAASRQASTGVNALRPGDAFGNHNPDADGFRRESVQIAGGWRPVAGQRLEATLLRTQLFSRYDGAEYSPPTYAPDASPDFRTDTRTEALQLAGQGALIGDVSWRARVGRSLDDSTSGGDELYRYRTRRDDHSVLLSWEPGGARQAVLAWDGRLEAVQASGYGGPQRRDNEAWTLSLTDRLGPVQWQADARRDRNSVYGTHHTARSGFRWSLTPQTALRLLAATTFRAPSFNELFFPGYGVLELRPEQGRSLEAGLSHREGALQWNATAWRNRVNNLIAYSADPARCPAQAAYAYGCAANIGQARLQGLTLEGRQLQGPWTWGYDYTDARDEAGRTLPRRARHQARLQLDQPLGDWRVGASTLWLSDRQEAGRTLRGNGRIDLQAQRPLGAAGSPWWVRLKVLNALNADFEPAADYRSPGRQWWLGIGWTGR